MTTQLLLELKKNRLLFIGLAAIFWPSLALAAWGLRSAGQKPWVGVDAALAFWTLAGPAGFALLFGASGGASLAAERDAEDVLPLSPRQRVFCSLAADALNILLLLLLIQLTAFALGRGIAIPVHPATLAYFWLTPLTAAYLLLLAFLLAHWLRHGMLGGILAPVAALPALAAFTAALGFNMDRDYPHFVWAGPLLALAVLVSVLPAVDKVSRWRALRPRWTPAALCAVLGSLLAAPVLVPVLYLRSNMASHRRLVLQYGAHTYSDAYSEASRLLPGTRAAAEKGALFASPRGDVMWVTPDGRRRLLREGAWTSPWLPPDRYAMYWSRSLAFDEDGTLWGLFRSRSIPGAAALLRGTPTTGLEPMLTVPDGFHVSMRFRGRTLGLNRWRGGQDGDSFAPMPSPGKPLAWEKAGDRRKLDQEAWVRAHEAAVLSPDKKSLSFTDEKGRRTAWRLPGEDRYPASPGELQFSYRLGGRRLFLVHRKLGEDLYGVAVCAPDGSVKTVWEGPHERWLDDLPDGTVFSWGRGQVLHMTLPDGTFLPPISLRKALQDAGQRISEDWFGASVVHREGSYVWLMVHETAVETGWFNDLFRKQKLETGKWSDFKLLLLKVDLGSGRLLDRRALPGSSLSSEDWSATSPAREGFFDQVRDRLYFIPWDGAPRNLGKV